LKRAHVRISEQAATIPLRRAPSLGLTRSRLTALLVAGLVLLPVLGFVYNALRYGRLIRLTDEYLYYVHARSWYFDGDCEYANDMLMAPGFETASHYAGVETRTGYTRNHFNCGTALVSVPFLAVADGMTLVHNRLADEPLPRDGYSTYFQFMVPLGHLLLGIGGLLAGYAVAARYFPPLVAAVAMHIVLLGTNAFYYIAIEPAHGHAASIAWVAFLLYLSDTIRHHGITLRRCALLGVVSGMMVVTRPQDLFWGIVPVVLVLPTWLRLVVGERRLLRGLAWAGAAGLLASLCYVPQAIVNWHLFGEFIHNAYAEVHVHGRPAVLHWTDPDLTRALFFPSTGILWTSPLVVVCMMGTVCLLRRREWTLRATALAFLAVYYLVACVWWVFTGFGHRYLSSCTIAFALGTCLVMMWASRRRWLAALLTTLAVAGIGWQTGLLLAWDRGWWDIGQVSPLYRLFFSPSADWCEPWV